MSAPMGACAERFPLVLVTNVKDEAAYLREWLEYHALVGVDHVYLYDQDGGEETRALLAPYEAAGLVTRHAWTHLDGTRYDGPTRCWQRNKNHLAFAHCARTYRERFDWALKIDADEFLVPPGGASSVRAWIAGLDRRRVRGVRVPRFDFGANGHRRRPEGLVLESYTRREARASNYKDLANGRFLSDNTWCASAHWWRYRLFPRGRLLGAGEAPVRIHHYYTKSLEEYLARQNVSRGRGRTEAHFLARDRASSAVVDETLLRFVPDVRRALAESPA